MNKYIKYTALMAILSLAILFSCQKNEGVEIDEAQAFEMTESAKIAYNKLVAFKQALDNPQKSTTSMQLDSAEWYVEAFYNVTLGYPDSLFGKFEVDTMYYTLPLDGNQMVAVADMGILLDNMENHLYSLLAQTGPEVAHMVVGDVVVDFSGRSSEAEITVFTGLGFGAGSPYTPFGEDEWWYWGATLGRCDIPEPIYSDAGEELEWRFNWPNPWGLPVPTCYNGRIRIIQSTHAWDLGENHPLIYSEFITGAYDPPCHSGEYWNTYLDHGLVLFFGSQSEGGLVPDGNTFFTGVNIFSDAINEGNGYRYVHNYQTFYSVYECLPSGGGLD